VELEKLKNRLTSFWVLHTFGWLFFCGATVWFSYGGKWTDFSRLLPFLLPYAMGFLVCIPLRFFYRRIQFHKYSLKYSILTGILASFLAANIWLGIDLATGLFIHRQPYLSTPIALSKIYPNLLYNRGIAILGWTFLYLGIKTRREWKQQEQSTEKANALAQAAQLQMLRYQLNPHFLFNAMNSIRALIDEDENKAREMITQLSEFLRYSLDSKNYSDVPLKNEIEAIQHYFAIQKKRYEDKLEVFYDIEPQVREFPVLSFLIHPLVENAIKYGMRTSPMPLTINLRAKILDGSLRIEVINTGKWIEPADSEGQMEDSTSTGLNNVRRRLENAFPGRHRFAIVEKEGKVHVQLDIRTAKKKDEKDL
jgi:two-component system LytT family sensor kinase